MTKAKGGYKIRKDGKKDTGRPTKFTPETISKLEQAFSVGCTDVEACLLANVSNSALYNYQQANPDFVERKERLKESLSLKSRLVIADKLNKDDVDTAKWYLERKKKNEFSTKIETGGVLGFTKVEGVNIDQIRELKKLFEE